MIVPAGVRGSAFDIVIVGSGLVGLALARSLAGSGLDIALVEREPAASPPNDASWDVRVYAISPVSELFLRQLHAWPADEQRLAPVEHMCIFADRPGSKLEFDAYQSHVSRLATIVENRLLMQALRNALGTGAEITRFSEEVCIAVEWHADAAVLQLQSGMSLRAKLLVAADGSDSWLRTKAGIEVSEIGYGQTAVVANFSCAMPHGGTAFQWFREDGVLALLPLPGQRISIVWSARDDLAARLMSLSDVALADLVAAASGNRLGALELITPPARFALRRIRVRRLIGPRLALVGDAAHNFHPLAGQGVNVGFQDARS